MKQLKSVLSAQTYTVRDLIKTPAEFALGMKRIREMGYTAVELAGVSDVPSGEVNAIIDDLGLNISGSRYFFDALQNDLDSVLARSHLWGVTNIHLTMMPESYAQMGAPGFRRFIDELSPIAETLFNNGFQLSYHNHNYELVHLTDAAGNKTTGLDQIFREIDSRHLHAQIDTYWIQAGGANPITWIQKMQGRLPTIHLKDMTVKMWDPHITEVGNGNLEWPAILTAAQEAGAQWFVVEQDYSDRNPFDSLQISYEYLTQLGLT